jgi:plastocyanin
MESDEQKQTGLIWLLIILVLIGFAAAAMYFGRSNQELAAALQSSSQQPAPTRSARIYTVYYGLGIFSPTNIRIHTGDSVKFQNDGNSPVRVVSDYTNGVSDLAGLDSVGDIPAGSAFTYTFSKAGIFGYHSAENPSEEGTVIVRP